MSSGRTRCRAACDVSETSCTLKDCVHRIWTSLTSCCELWGYLSAWILLSITNEMQRYTVFFVDVNALHVSGGFSVHHQEIKTVHTASGICQAVIV